MFNLALHDPEVHQAVQHLIETSRRNSRVESDRISAVESTLTKIWEILSMLHPDVQKLLDESAEVKALLVSYHDKIVEADTKIADLNAKLAAVPVAEPISAENLAALQEAGASLAATITVAKAEVAPAAAPAAVAEAPAEAPAAEAPAPAADAQAAPAADPAAAAPAPDAPTGAASS